MERQHCSGVPWGWVAVTEGGLGRSVSPPLTNGASLCLLVLRRTDNQLLRNKALDNKHSEYQTDAMLMFVGERKRPSIPQVWCNVPLSMAQSFSRTRAAAVGREQRCRRAYLDAYRRTHTVSVSRNGHGGLLSLELPRHSHCS